MKVFIGLIVVLSATRFCFAADPEMNPCTLVPKEELAKIIGEKGSANDPKDVAGLGEEAFTDKRGTDAEIYIRKGKWILEVRTSSGGANARKVADYAFAKTP
jgi:hypothetical protein